ncbi:MAG: enoyl-CoA hydratase-related protein, partial [Gammaproteobacteria bacterium]|nr:enoyl-CoA hydratase-related protein [Gammaproteobacteria bacterium]
FVTTAFANIGLSGDYGGSWVLTRLVGPALAKGMYMTARRLPAEECLVLGIANRVVLFDELQQTANELARQVANGPRTAVRYMKENINFAQGADLKASLAQEADRMVRCSRTDDHREAVRAFMEKRPPRFNRPA